MQGCDLVAHFGEGDVRDIIGDEEHLQRVRVKRKILEVERGVKCGLQVGPPRSKTVLPIFLAFVLFLLSNIAPIKVRLPCVILLAFPLHLWSSTGASEARQQGSK
eukprot:6138381-Prymnesium_polylepis.2